MSEAIDLIDVKATIRALAERYNIRYAITGADILGHHITRLSGDEVNLDEAAFLLLALERSGHITSAEAARLHGDYLRAKYE